MRPVILRGHTRPITQIKYNKEGDLLFSTAKDGFFNVWLSETGERLGNFKEQGALSSFDVTEDSEYVVTGNSTGYISFWKVNGGTKLGSIRHNGPVKSVEFSLGCKYLLTASDRFLENHPMIQIFSMEDVWKLLKKNENSTNSDEKEVLLDLDSIMSNTREKNKAVYQIKWGPLNETFYLSNNDGSLEQRNAEDGSLITTIKPHSNEIREFQISADFSLLITASKDGYSKLFDARTLKELKVFNAGKPINSALVSPLYLDKVKPKYHVLIGGGQEARDVATTEEAKAGFECHFYNFIYGEEIATISGHIGPINTIAMNNAGTAFATGGEDGYVRIHKLDQDYFTNQIYD